MYPRINILFRSYSSGKINKYYNTVINTTVINATVINTTVINTTVINTTLLLSRYEFPQESLLFMKFNIFNIKYSSRSGSISRYKQYTYWDSVIIYIPQFNYKWWFKIAYWLPTVGMSRKILIYFGVNVQAYTLLNILIKIIWWKSFSRCTDHITVRRWHLFEFLQILLLIWITANEHV